MFKKEANKSCEPPKAYIYSVIILSTLLAALLAIVACFIYRALRAKKARSTGARSYELLVTKKRDVEKNLEEVDDVVVSKSPDVEQTTKSPTDPVSVTSFQVHPDNGTGGAGDPPLTANNPSKAASTECQPHDSASTEDPVDSGVSTGDPPASLVSTKATPDETESTQKPSDTSASTQEPPNSHESIQESPVTRVLVHDTSHGSTDESKESLPNAASSKVSPDPVLSTEFPANPAVLSTEFPVDSVLPLQASTEVTEASKQAPTEAQSAISTQVSNLADIAV